MVSSPPLELRTDDAEGVAALAQVLHDAGYVAAQVHAALGVEGSFSSDPAEVPLYLRVLPPRERLSTLVKLFLLGVAVEPEEAEAAFAPLSVERLQGLGVLTAGPGAVSSTIHLAPTEDLLVASDRPEGPVAAGDHVLGLSAPTRVLACLTVRREVGAALDIGTGSGIQAIVTAPHAERVVATDVNPRALRFAAFNALLNGRTNVEVREGSLFDPVEGETFDLIVSNPPYVISPETHYVYRDSGLPGDSFCEGLVRRLPEYLNEGGFANLLVTWAYRSGEDWSEPLRRWVEGSGCDAILFHYVTRDPLSYAAGWNQPLRSDEAAYAAAIDRWLAYYRELGIDELAWGGIVLRRRSGRNWVWGFSPPSERIGPASDQILRLFAARDFLEERGEAALLDERLAPADDHRLEQAVVLGGGEARVENVVIHFRGGLRFGLSIDPPTVQILALLDGRRTLRDVVEGLARAEGVDLDPLVEHGVAPITRLFELGFLVRS